MLIRVVVRYCLQLFISELMNVLLKIAKRNKIISRVTNSNIFSSFLLTIKSSFILKIARIV